LVENLFLLGGIKFSHLFSLTSFLAAIFIFIMGYMGLLNSEIFAEPKIAKSISQLQELSYRKKIDNLMNIETKEKKYEKSGLSDKKAKIYLEKLLKLMDEEKPYIDSNLTLISLAEKLSISPHNFSEVINTQLNKNFFDFINQYRVEEAKKLLTDPHKQHLKILAIAYDAGFNSKTSFNTIFKKFTKLTPSEYRNQIFKN
jgi:AraC-like DNA-binding protein